MKSLSFGAVIWDEAGDVRTLGGDALNFSAHMAKHGAESYFFTRIGSDENGRKALQEMKGLGVLTEFVQEDAQHETGRASIELDDSKVPFYRFNRNASNEYIEINYHQKKNITALRIDVFHFTSFCLDCEISRGTLFELLELGAFQTVFYDLNIRKGFRDKRLIAQGIQHADMLKINEDELELLNDLLGSKGFSTEDLMEKLFDNPKLTVICVTKGERGCDVFQRDASAFHLPGNQVKVVNTVGAGDAFISAFAFAYVQGQPLRVCAERGNFLGSYVAGHHSAIPEYDGQMRQHLGIGV